MMRQRYDSAMPKHSSHILEMARKGAEHRYEELKAEMAALVKNFPHLADRARRQVANAVSRGRRAIALEAKKVGRRRRRMSAAARKAVSTGMRAYWAARRKAQGR